MALAAAVGHSNDKADERSAGQKEKCSDGFHECPRIGRCGGFGLRAACPMRARTRASTCPRPTCLIVAKPGPRFPLPVRANLVVRTYSASPRNPDEQGAGCKRGASSLPPPPRAFQATTPGRFGPDRDNGRGPLPDLSSATRVGSRRRAPALLSHKPKLRFKCLRRRHPPGGSHSGLRRSTE